MTWRYRAVLGAIAVSAALGATATTAAAEANQPPLGAHVSECARDALGKRPSPPSVSCRHDGVVDAFADFGAMVAHLREHR